MIVPGPLPEPDPLPPLICQVQAWVFPYYFCDFPDATAPIAMAVAPKGSLGGDGLYGINGFNSFRLD